VRYAPQYRADPQALGQVLVAAPNGSQIPLSQVARIEHARGPAMISSENGLLIATVLMNVQGRDVGSFVNNARQTVAREVSLPAGYYVGWSGRWENQEHARQRLRVVLPIVLLVIFVLLYVTYHSIVEAAHVLLAVPFALTGGVYLLWLLGYNFSVAVWVGFIALFGTAVQTGVVMVIYLEEAVTRKRAAMGGTLTRPALREAVIEGALLRLRPKVMTVSTVIAGLLPIMWSTRVGAEVIEALATPVLGGMVSSLLHVLIVTPVLFFWLQERRLGLKDEHDPLPVEQRRVLTKRRLIVALGVLSAIAAMALAYTWRTNRPAENQAGATVTQVRSGDLTIVVRSATGTLRQGRNMFTIEFQSASGSLVDRRHRAREREHDDAGHGDVRRACGRSHERTGTLSGDRRIRHGRGVADDGRMGRTGRAWLGQFSRTSAMRTRTPMWAGIGVLVWAVGVNGQVTATVQSEALAPKYFDTVTGLTLPDAIVWALEHEPSILAVRTDPDVARGMRQQAALRPNPTASFMQLEEPAGTDRQSKIEVQWPLDLFRRPGRVAVADREVEVTERIVADRERLLRPTCA